jgi:hypothetical protein
MPGSRTCDCTRHSTAPTRSTARRLRCRFPIRTGSVKLSLPRSGNLSVPESIRPRRVCSRPSLAGTTFLPTTPARVPSPSPLRLPRSRISRLFPTTIWFLPSRDFRPPASLLPWAGRRRRSVSIFRSSDDARSTRESQYISSIERVQSADIVTRPSAGGRLQRVLQSDAPVSQISASGGAGPFSDRSPAFGQFLLGRHRGPSRSTKPQIPPATGARQRRRQTLRANPLEARSPGFPPLPSLWPEWSSSCSRSARRRIVNSACCARR